MKNITLTHDDGFSSTFAAQIPNLYHMYRLKTYKDKFYWPEEYREVFSWFQNQGYISMLQTLDIISEEDAKKYYLITQKERSGEADLTEGIVADNVVEEIMKMMQLYPSDHYTMQEKKIEDEKVPDWELFFELNKITPYKAIEDLLTSIPIMEMPLINAFGILDRAQYMLLGAVDCLYVLGICTWSESCQMLKKYMPDAIKIDAAQIAGKDASEMRRDISDMYLKYRDYICWELMLDEEKYPPASLFREYAYQAWLNGYFHSMLEIPDLFTEDDMECYFEAFCRLCVWIPAHRMEKARFYDVDRAMDHWHRWEREIEFAKMSTPETLARYVVKQYRFAVMDHDKELTEDQLSEIEYLHGIGAIDCLHDIGYFAVPKDEINAINLLEETIDSAVGTKDPRQIDEE